MTKFLFQIIQERNNDYSAFEVAYHAKTGDELVYEPFTSPQYASSKMTLSTSVIIPAWNAQDTIIQCLIAIEQSSFNRRYPHLLEAIVVDDGSTDNTWKLLTHLQLDLNLKVVRQAHHSRAHAMNTGISIADGDIIISCDADIILCPFSIEELMKRHQVLEKVLLIGFRFDVDKYDPRVHPSVLRRNLPNFLPEFYGDNRVVFHWPGWPENMCAESNHFKQLGQGKQFWVTDGNTPDGDSWNLPRMVYGTLFSLRRDDFKQIGGYDERFFGWGWEDTTVGAQAIALGNFIVPIYSAVGLHIRHPDRSSSKWQEANTNYRLLQSILHSPFALNDGRVFMQARRRISSQLEYYSSGRYRDVPGWWYDVFETKPNHRYRLGKYLYHLGRYDEAAMAFTNSNDSKPDEIWLLFNQGKALRAAGRHTEAIIVLREAVERFPYDASCLVELSLALAACEQFVKARAYLDQAHYLDPENQLLSYVINNAADIYIRRGRKYAAQGFHSLAVRDFEAALIQEPHSIAVRQERSHSLSKVM